MIVRVKHFFNKNYEFILSLFLLFIILIVAINPTPYIDTTLKGLTIWAKIVLPSLFCFFIFTKLLMQLKGSIKIFDFLNKPFAKIFRSGQVGGYVFAMSIISGYPLGAKLISEFYQSKTITLNEAHRLLAFSSTSGPMFILGSLAIGMLGNLKIGIVILLSHLAAALLNGLIFRNYNHDKNEPISNLKTYVFEVKKDSLNDIMYNTIISSLMVGGYITICFAILEIGINLNIFAPISFVINKILPSNAQFAEGIIKGIVEVTNGCVSLAEGQFAIKPLTVALTGLMSFGGLSIHLQSQMFLKKCNIKYRYFLLTKILHTTISIIISLISSYIFL